MVKEREYVDNSCGTAAVVLGIISIVFPCLTFLAFFAPFIGLALGITAFFFALAQRKAIANKWSRAGLILAIIGVVINVGILLIMLAIIAQIGMKYEELCTAAGGCENIGNYIATQQAEQVISQYGAGA